MERWVDGWNDGWLMDGVVVGGWMDGMTEECMEYQFLNHRYGATWNNIQGNARFEPSTVALEADALPLDRLVGLVVRRPPRERKVPGLNPTCAGIFSGSSHTSDLNIGTPVATLPGAWRYRVSAGTGRPGVSIL